MRPRFEPRDVVALLEVLAEADRIKPFQVVKRRVFERYGIAGSDRDRVLTAIAYRLYRLQGVLDRAAAKALNATPDWVRGRPPLVRYALRLAAFLAQFDAVGDERLKGLFLRHGLAYVASRYGWREARLAARVLKRLERDPWRPETEEERIELTYMLPAWLVRELRRLLPEAEVEELARAFNTDPVPGLRVNTLLASIDRVTRMLERAGVEYWVSERVPNHIRYRAPFTGVVRELVEKGLAVPQDESSAAAAPLLDPRPGQLVLDMCAAPGGKATHLAELARLEALVVGLEIYPDRVERLYELAVRTRTYPALQPVLADARTAPRLAGRRFDRVLLDPPCSSTGALAKHPDARWRLSRDTLRELVDRQKQMLKAAVEAAKPGSLILYTVCSILPEEGEELVKWALESLPVELEPLKGPYDESKLLPGTMRAWPHRHGTTGFFYALLRRR